MTQLRPTIALLHIGQKVALLAHVSQTRWEQGTKACVRELTRQAPHTERYCCIDRDAPLLLTCVMM